MKDVLTNQDKKFVKELIETGNQTQSAKKAYKYEDDNVAGVMANRKLRNVKIQEAIKTIADSISDEDLIQKHKELLESSYVDHMTFPLGPKTNAEKEEYHNKEREKATKKENYMARLII